MMPYNSHVRDIMAHADPHAELHAELRALPHLHMLMATPIAMPMAMPSLVPRYTLRDLDRFPNDGNRYELLDGFLLVTPAPHSPHQILQSMLVRELTFYFGRRPSVYVLTPGAVEVAPGTHLEPDVLVIPNTGKPPESWLAVRDWWLAIEISGRGSRVYDRDFKGPAYLRAGVRAYWRIDLRDRCVYVSTSAEPFEVRHETPVSWSPPDSIAEPLVVDIPALFEGIEGDD